MLETTENRQIFFLLSIKLLEIFLKKVVQSFKYFKFFLYVHRR